MEAKGPLSFSSRDVLLLLKDLVLGRRNYSRREFVSEITKERSCSRKKVLGSCIRKLNTIAMSCEFSISLLLMKEGNEERNVRTSSSKRCQMRKETVAFFF